MAAGGNQFDADLLRVRKVRVTLRVQVASAALRGMDQTLCKNPGKSQGGAKIRSRLHRRVRSVAAKPEPGAVRRT